MSPRNALHIKLDINFLDKPLWFQNLRYDGFGFVWNDIEGYEYKCGDKPPDKVDILFLLYFLYKSQAANYCNTLILNRFEILKACGFADFGSQYYRRLEKSLNRWSTVSIHFEGTFYDGGNYLTKNFHIMKASINKDTKQVEVIFDTDWILKIKESKYYKYINFGYYRALKRPLSRRLHELLCRNFMNRDTCFFRLTTLGTKLTLSGRKTKNGNVIYASDVLVAIKPAINEINRLSRDPKITKNTGISPKDLFTLTYEIAGKKQDRVITFQRHPIELLKPKQKQQTPESTNIQILLELLKKRTPKLEQVISNYLQQKGFSYVKWNILYANQKATKNYSTYLQKALAKNWAEEWAEEEKERIECKMQQKHNEEQKEREGQLRALQRLQAEKEIPMFLEKVERVPQEKKLELWATAEESITQNTVRRENLVKIQYMNLLWEHLDGRGESFSKAILDDFRLAFQFSAP